MKKIILLLLILVFVSGCVEKISHLKDSNITNQETNTEYLHPACPSYLEDSKSVGNYKIDGQLLKALCDNDIEDNKLLQINNNEARLYVHLKDFSEEEANKLKDYNANIETTASDLGIVQIMINVEDIKNLENNSNIERISGVIYAVLG